MDENYTDRNGITISLGTAVISIIVLLSVGFFGGLAFLSATDETKTSNDEDIVAITETDDIETSTAQNRMTTAETENLDTQEELPLSSNANRQGTPLNRQMITRLDGGGSFSNRPQNLEILGRSFDFGIIMTNPHGSTVTINTAGYSTMRGTIAFDNGGLQAMQRIEVEIRQNDYWGVNLDNIFINHGEIIDFETDISGVDQLIIRRLFNVLYSGTTVIIGDIYFE